jgi:hypothetical protein
MFGTAGLMARVTKLMSTMKRVVPLYAVIAFVPLFFLQNAIVYIMGDIDIPYWFRSITGSVYVIVISLPAVFGSLLLCSRYEIILTVVWFFILNFILMWIIAFRAYSNYILLKRLDILIVVDGIFTESGLIIYSMIYASTSFVLACAFFYALKNLQRGD